MKKNTFIFYGLFFKEMTFSACPEAFKNISNSLTYMIKGWAENRGLFDRKFDIDT